MGIPVLILGESGSGKTASLRNFNAEELGIFNVAGKELPFPKKFNRLDNATYEQIERALRKGSLKRYVIDDSQYLMAFEQFDRADEPGYGKYTGIAVHFRNLIKTVVTQTPGNTLVYFLHHTEPTDAGGIKAKTCGKMIDNQLTLEGLFTIVLLAKTDGKRHWFETQSDGFTTVKSPMEMFDSIEIDNDLAAVDARIRAYYEL